MRNWQTLGPPGSDFQKVPPDNRGYTFHLKYTEEKDINLATKVEATVHEQLSDPNFLNLWRFYTKRNRRAADAYDARLYEIEMEEKQEEWDAA